MCPAVIELGGQGNRCNREQIVFGFYVELPRWIPNLEAKTPPTPPPLSPAPPPLPEK